MMRCRKLKHTECEGSRCDGNGMHCHATQLPPHKTPVATEQRAPALAGAAPLSVMVAAGPFTTADSLEFEPLTELLAAAARTPPVSIFCGP